MAAVQLAQSLQTIVTRNRNPLDPAFISITQIHTGSVDNVIPNDATLRGTVRTFSDINLDLIENRMRDITEHTSRALDCQARFTFLRRYPPTINHDREAAFCADVIKGIVGEAQVDQCISPSIGAAVFAFMLKELPRSEERRVGNECVGKCIFRWSPYHYNTNSIYKKYFQY